MERLTKRIEQYVYYTQGKYEETLPVEMETNDIRSVLKKLADYEDLEEKLEKVYGKCEGLLETAVNSLVKHEGAEISTPAKARLLTDEDVDKWESFKDAEKQGLLLRLPCKCGDKVYTACSWGIESGVVGSIEIISDMVFVNNPYRAMIGQAHNIFLTKEEAEQALAKMKEV